MRIILYARAYAGVLFCCFLVTASGRIMSQAHLLNQFISGQNMRIFGPDDGLLTNWAKSG